MLDARAVPGRQGVDRDWGAVAATTIGLVLSLGTLTTCTIGVFVAPLSAEFGWTRTQLLFGIAVSQYALAASAPLWGALMDRLGPRPAMKCSHAIKAGSVWVNQFGVNDVVTPVGGYKRSGFGKDFGVDGMLKYMHSKSIAIRMP